MNDNAIQDVKKTPRSPHPLTICRVLRWLADNEGAGYLEVGFAHELANEIGDLSEENPPFKSVDGPPKSMRDVLERLISYRESIMAKEFDSNGSLALTELFADAASAITNQRPLDDRKADAWMAAVKMVDEIKAMYELERNDMIPDAIKQDARRLVYEATWQLEQAMLEIQGEPATVPGPKGEALIRRMEYVADMLESGMFHMADKGHMCEEADRLAKYLRAGGR